MNFPRCRRLVRRHLDRFHPDDHHGHRRFHPDDHLLRASRWSATDQRTISVLGARHDAVQRDGLRNTADGLLQCHSSARLAQRTAVGGHHRHDDTDYLVLVQVSGVGIDSDRRTDRCSISVIKYVGEALWVTTGGVHR